MVNYFFFQVLLANDLVKIGSCFNGADGTGNGEGDRHQDNLQQPEPQSGGLLQDGACGGGGGSSAEG